MISGAKMNTIVARHHDGDDRDHEPSAQLAEVLDDRHAAVGIALLAEGHGAGQAGSAGAPGSGAGAGAGSSVEAAGAAASRGCHGCGIG